MRCALGKVRSPKRWGGRKSGWHYDSQRYILEMHNAKIPQDAAPVLPWLSVSVGVASMVAAPNLLPRTVVEQAEGALLHGKQAGCARFEVFGSLV